MGDVGRHLEMDSQGDILLRIAITFISEFYNLYKKLAKILDSLALRK